MTFTARQAPLNEGRALGRRETDRQRERRSNNTIAGSTPAAAGTSGRHATPARPAANGSCAPAAAVKAIRTAAPAARESAVKRSVQTMAARLPSGTDTTDSTTDNVPRATHASWTPDRQTHTPCTAHHRADLSASTEQIIAVCFSIHKLAVDHGVDC